MRPAAAASARARAPCLSFQWLAYARPCNWPAPRQAVLRVRLCSCAGPSAAGLPLKTQHPVGSCIMLFQVKCGPILDRREPHLHAPSSSMVRLPHICTTPTTLHLPASHPASHPASRPAPYQYPAPHSHCTTWTSFCTMPCSTLVLHHTAPPCTTLAYTTSACTTLDHTHAPHLPCTTSALHHTRLHHIRPALTGLTAEGDNKKQQREQAFLDAKCFEEINNKMVVECYKNEGSNNQCEHRGKADSFDFSNL